MRHLSGAKPEVICEKNLPLRTDSVDQQWERVNRDHEEDKENISWDTKLSRHRSSQL